MEKKSRRKVCKWMTGREGRSALQNAEFNRINPLTMTDAAWVAQLLVTAVL